MNRRETERILEVIRSARDSGQRVALATVVRVKGSAYRREGARIAVREDGSYECLLSGGCLEPAVAEAAARVIGSGRPTIAQYDLEEDSVWSLGVGCSGAVDIFIERIDDTPIMRAWLDALARADAAVLVKPLADADARLLVTAGGHAGTLGAGALDAEAARVARERLRHPFPMSGPQRVDGLELFFEVSAPPPELVIFGANSDADPLARLAWELGFTVTVVDAREAFLSRDRFPHAALIAAHHSAFAGSVRLTERSSAVIMNHHLERDRESLRFALESTAPYIGALGPRSRFYRLLDALRADGYEPDAARLARVRSPVGLALGAETPEEIAIAILGEIIALQRGFDGGFLDGRDTGLHRSPESRVFASS